MRCLAVLLTLAALAVAAAPAQAAETTVTVTGTVAHVYGTPATSPPCVVATFYRWADVPGTVSASASYVYTGTDGSAETSIGTKPAPFDDAFDAYGFDAAAPAGQHQLYAGYASIQGTGPRDCSQDAELVASRGGYAATAQITLTVDKAKTPACATAKQRLAAQAKVVKQRKASVRKAKSAAAERKAKRKLASAKRKQGSLRKAATTAC